MAKKRSPQGVFSNFWTYLHVWIAFVPSSIHIRQVLGEDIKMISIKHSIALHMSSTYRRTEHPDHKGSPSHPGCKGYQGNGFGSHPDASLKQCIC